MIDFLIIGGAKCGSTSLAEYLESCEGVNFSRAKEPCHLLIEDFNEEVEKEYLGLFKTGPGLKGEASTGYSDLRHVSTVIKNIKLKGWNPKIIFLVRNPIKRVESGFMEALKTDSVKNNDFPAFFYRSFTSSIRGLFGTAYCAYKKAFGKENILVLNFDSMISESKSELGKVHEFLNLKVDPKKEFLQRNKSVGSRKRNFISKFYLNNRQFLKKIIKPEFRIYLGELNAKHLNFTKKITKEDAYKLSESEVEFLNLFYELDSIKFKEELGWDYFDLKL